MSNWPIPSPAMYEAVGADASNSRGTTITSGTSNNKGSYSELIAATAFDYDALLVTATSYIQSERHLMDIAIGAGGSEIIIVENFFIPYRRADFVLTLIPIRVAAGSRIAARTQANNASKAQYTMIHGVNFGWPMFGAGFGAVETLGAETADTSGTTIDPGASANTKGAWTEFSAAIGDDYRALMAIFGNDNDDTKPNENWLVDIGIGASGSEVVVVPDIQLATGTAQDGPLPNGFVFPLLIPAGERVAVRAACDTNTSPDRLIDAVLYGIG